MKIKLRIVITGLTCVFLLVSGILYSCAYQGSKSSAVLISTSADKLTEDDAVQAEAVLQDSSETQNNKGALANDGTKDNEGIQPSVSSDQTQSYIYTHICGAVVNPGVYRLIEGARLVELIELAGGLTETAAGDYINQAGEVHDGQRIYVPEKEELTELSVQEYQAGEAGTDSEQTENSLVNINTADEDELMNLPGIGQAKAASIISYRNTNGAFKTTEELMNIPGIKQGLFGQISSMITVE